jgi:MFS family permease
MTFGVISYRLVDAGLVSASAVPLVYTAAMAAEAVAALAIGDLFDRWGPGVLLAVPLLVCAVPALVLSDQLRVVVVGIVIWGAATGVQDSTVKAHIAGLVAARRRATAYGVFAAVQGIGALVGGALAGALIVHHGGLLVAGVVVVQVASLVLLATTLRADRAATRAD